MNPHAKMYIHGIDILSKVKFYIAVDDSGAVNPLASQTFRFLKDPNMFWISRNDLFLVSGMIMKMYIAIKKQMAKNTRKQYCFRPICANET